MRITSVDMPKEHSHRDGLGEIRMKKLGPIVVLAGKNGSGKSRLLTRIRGLTNPRQGLYQEIQRKRERLEQIKSSTDLLHVEERSHIEVELVSYGALDFSDKSSSSLALDFVPKQLGLEDCDSFSATTLVNEANGASEVGVGFLPKKSFAVIQHVQNRRYEMTHQESSAAPEQKAMASRDYDNLKALIKAFLGTTLERSPEGKATLFGRRLGEVSLSDGQSVVLQLCVAFHKQGPSLAGHILLLDEPENHLHPSAMLEIIDILKKNVGNGQLWIATHSIPLLAHIEPSSIWWMENGTVSHAGSIPKKVLEGLLGDTERVSKLADFLNYPAQLASNLFSTQCLTSPDVVGFQVNDPQLRQIREALQGVSGGPVRMLDFGAGKGRLASALYDAEGVDKDKLKDRLDYVALDSYSANKADCENAIARIYGSAEGRYFNDYKRLLEKRDKESFDVVVMCNVLHEIEPCAWLGLFQEGGEINQLLKPEGFLLLVEDTEIPVGEKAHQKGFLVLDTTELKDLFAIKSVDTGFSYSSEREGRLKAHKIPREFLSRITPGSRKAAVDGVYQNAKRAIRKLRGLEGSYQNGRKHGFWVQQLANAELVLEEWRGNR